MAETERRRDQNRTETAYSKSRERFPAAETSCPLVGVTLILRFKIVFKGAPEIFWGVFSLNGLGILYVALQKLASRKVHS